MELREISASIAVELLEVDRKIKDQLQVLCRNNDLVTEVFQSFFQTPGKKLRPSLVLLSAFALRQENLRAAHHQAAHGTLINLATITELVHCASLMHDDVLDAALTRRGIPSLNARFGDKMAILAGDMLYSQAFELLASTANPLTIQRLALCVHRMCRGEIINLRDHDFEGYLGIIEDKTASFMALCCQMGAESVRSDGSDPEHITALSRFGYHFGMVYQLLDDLGDHDDINALLSEDRVRKELAAHIQGAEHTLAGIPDSAFKRSLFLLLHYVIEKSEGQADQTIPTKTSSLQEETDAHIRR